MTEKFKVGDLVWAKLRYWPAWPAKVVDHPLGAIKKNSYYVFFYGSENYAWIKNANISSYIQGYDIKRDFRSSAYRKAVQQIAEIFHEYQLKNDSDFIKIRKPKRTLEEEKERQRKIQERLKVRWFPKKPAEKKVSKNRIVKKEKSSANKAASGSSSSVSSSPLITTVHSPKKGTEKKGNKTRTVRKGKKSSVIETASGSSSSISPASPLITTVHVNDYKKVIVREMFVWLQRIDSKIPHLIRNSDEPEYPPEEAEPPILLPEV